MDMGCGLCGLGDAMLLFVFQFVLAPPLTGVVTGLLSGWMLPRLRWWPWALLGLAVGAGFVVLRTGLLVFQVSAEAMTGEFTQWWISHIFALLPFPFVLYLALRRNERQKPVARGVDDTEPTVVFGR